MNIPQENRILLIKEEALRVNNFIDCDVIQEAIDQLDQIQNPSQIVEVVENLIFCITYRGGKTARIKNYLTELKTSLEASNVA